MKLDSFEPSFEQDQIKIRELEYLLQQPSYLESRPCARCDKECDCSQSLSCPCICGPDCEHAPSAMSSDPIRYPIEKKIVTLVFSFNCLRVCPPYWSCEGHNFKNGELFRVPQVWFYSKSMIYPKLIDEYVLGLQRENLIAYPWHVCLAYAENSLETGFSIEPDVNKKGVRFIFLTQIMQKNKSVPFSICLTAASLWFFSPCWRRYGSKGLKHE